MSAAEKAEVLVTVASSPTPKRKVLRELGVARSTYYRWLKRREQRGLENDAGGGRPPWNRMTSREVDHVLSVAREMPELSPRQLAAWVTDNMGFSVSESTVYRILRREGLVKRPEMRLAADKEYHRKTTGPHQMWATDAERQRSGLCIKSLQGLPGDGGHQAHTGCSLPSSDQRQARALPSDPQAGREPAAV